MDNIAEQGSRALEAVADLKALLRLSHEALHRIKQEVHGTTFDSVEVMSFKLHDLRHEADDLDKKVNGYIKDIEIKTYG